MNIFQEGDPVDPDLINQNFAEVDSKQFFLGEAMSAGDLVRIVDDSGESKVYSIFESLAAALGDELALSFDAATVSSVYDPVKNIIIVAYASESRQNLIVGTPNPDNTITWGNAVQINSYSTSTCPVLWYDSINSATIIGYQISGNYYLGVVSVTEARVPSVVDGFNIMEPALQTLVEYKAGSFILVYFSQGSPTMQALVVNISGTTLTQNTAASHQVYDMTGGKVVINEAKTKLYFVTYNTDSSDNYVNQVVSANVSGNTITFNSNYLTYSGSSPRKSYNNIILAGEVPLMFYYNYSDSTYYAAFITDNNGTLSLGTPFVLDPPTETRGTVAIRWYTSGGDEYMQTGTITSEGITWNTAEKIVTGYTYSPIVYVSKYSYYIMFRYGYYRYFRPEGKYPTKKESAVGIVQQDGITGDIKSVVMDYGISKVHSGHTIGARAFIQSDGTAGETETEYPIGYFTSPTNLLFLKGREYIEIIPQVISSGLTAATWYNWDISLICPNARYVEVMAYSTNATANDFGVRKYGSAKNRIVELSQYQSMLFKARVESGKVQIYNELGASYKFTITGYWT